MNITNESLADYTAPERKRCERKLEKNHELGKDENFEIYGIPYDQYLRKSLWKKIVVWVKERDKNTCQVCGSTINNLEVHHRDYDRETMEGKNDKGLITLCQYCHHKVEFYDENELNKRKDLELKDKYLVKLISQYKNWKNSENERIAELKKIADNMTVELHRYQKFKYFPDFTITANLSKHIDNYVNINSWFSSIYSKLTNSKLNLKSIFYPEFKDTLLNGKEVKMSNIISKKPHFYISLPRPNQLKIRSTNHCDIDLEEILDEIIDNQNGASITIDQMLTRSILAKNEPCHEDNN